MPDWSIKIVKQTNGKTVFVPDLKGAKPGDPLTVWVDDLVSWNNTTNDTHQITASNGTDSFTTDEIQAGYPSTPLYDVAPPSGKNPPTTWTVNYSCVLHPKETGKIIATPVGGLETP